MSKPKLSEVYLADDEQSLESVKHVVEAVHLDRLVSLCFDKNGQTVAFVDREYADVICDAVNASLAKNKSK
jgi:hypothetical protein